MVGFLLVSPNHPKEDPNFESTSLDGTHFSAQIGDAKWEILVYPSGPALGYLGAALGGCDPEPFGRIEGNPGLQPVLVCF